MSKAAHTPGPWIANCFQVMAGSDRIAHTGQRQLPPPRSHEAEANAVLVAASPDLLAAAKLALRLIDDLMPGVRYIALQDYALLNDAPLALKKAIEKAEAK